MVELAADENFNGPLLAALVRRLPLLDAARVQDSPAAGRPDPAMLEWAAGEGRVLLTHDGRTIPKFAYDRGGRGRPMPGVIVVPKNLAPGPASDDLELLLSASDDDEFANRVRYVPL